MKDFCKGVVFWVLSLTWGLLMTLIGAFIALGCIIAEKEPKIFNHTIYFVFGHGSWGFSCGAFFFLSKDCEDNFEMKLHESGHCYQNIMLGVFMPFIVSIPSMVRFYYRDWLVKTKRKKYYELPPYDNAWFENWATKLGKKCFYCKKKKK